MQEKLEKNKEQPVVISKKKKIEGKARCTFFIRLAFVKFAAPVRAACKRACGAPRLCVQTCVSSSVRVRQSPTVKGRCRFNQYAIARQKSKPAKSLRARYNSGGASEPHLDIYFPIGSKTKGALQGPAFVRRTPVRAHQSALYNYSPSAQGLQWLRVEGGVLFTLLSLIASIVADGIAEYYRNPVYHRNPLFNVPNVLFVVFLPFNIAEAI